MGFLVLFAVFWLISSGDRADEYKYTLDYRCKAMVEEGKYETKRKCKKAER